MSNKKAPFEFEILTTADKSPTLSLSGGEKMHSMEGAFSESLYIYWPCIQKIASLPSPRVLSMGLGLGYNELISLAHFLKYGTQDFYIESFEKVPELRTFFSGWLKEDQTPLNPCYDSILEKVTSHFQIPSFQLKSEALLALDSGRLNLKQELHPQSTTDKAFHAILYDAFSSRTDEQLWSDEHLKNFLHRFADRQSCWLATYAATGSLKRALLHSGFQLEKKAGFGKKRDSTFAMRLSTSVE